MTFPRDQPSPSREQPFASRGLRRTLGSIVAALGLAGCASVPQPDVSTVQTRATETAGAPLAWPRDNKERGEVDARVLQLLGGTLTAETAVQIATLNNRDLRATLEDLGISQADLVTASLWRNPIFAATLRWPNQAPRGPDAEFSLAADLFDGLLIPIRKKVATEHLAQAEDRVCDQVLALSGEVKRAVYTYQAAVQFESRLQMIAQGGDAAVDLAQRQFDAGNINQLELDTRQVVAEQAKADALLAQMAVSAAREEVNRLLCLSPSQLGWKGAALPPLQETRSDTTALLAAAPENRPDLQAAKGEVTLLGMALKLKEQTRLLPGSVDLGVDTERNPDGSRVTGPTLQVGLPLFDQGQADLARLQAALRQAQARYEGRLAEAQSDIRAAADALSARWEVAHYYVQTVLPHHQHLVQETLLHYNAMQKSSFELLDAKESEVTAERNEIEAIRDYWIARATLERATGVRLDPSPSS